MSRKGGRLKGQNLNHLLNFHYEERPKFEDYAEARRTRGRGGNSRRRGYNEPFDKHKYVAANFRFILDPQSVRSRVLTVATGQDIPGLSKVRQHVAVSSEASKASAKEVANTMNFAENWQDVLGVIVNRDSEAQCPICLEKARVARVTNCGHVYCLVCMLLYLTTFDDSKSFPRCPICFESLDVKDLRLAIVQEVETASNGNKLDFSLLCSKRGESIPLLFGEDCRTFYGLPLADSRLAMYSRVSVATKEFMQPVLENELKDLEYVLQEALNYGDHGRQLFAQDLKKKIEDDLLSWIRRKPIPAQELDGGTQGIFPKGLEHLLELPEKIEKQAAEDNSKQGDAGKEGSKKPKKKKGNNKKDTQVTTPPPSLTDTRGNERFFCYQTSTGQFAFLHPFNVSCLMHQASQNPLRLPTSVSAPVVAITEKQLTNEVLRRNPSLSHLPHMAIVQEVEVELEDLLSDETKNAFKNELKRRRKQRSIKEKKLAAQLAKEVAMQEAEKAMQQQGYSWDEMDPDLLEALAVSAATAQPSGGSAPRPVPSSTAPRERSSGSLDTAGSPPGSFASIVTNMGHYPSLGESAEGAQADSTAQASAAAWQYEVLGNAKPAHAGSWAADPPQSGWPRAQRDTSSPNVVPLIPAGTSFAAMASKKGGRQNVFTNSSRRGYR